MNNKNIIDKINLSSDNLYTNLNNQIDTTGRINEKIQKNKFNYIVNEILEEEPEPTEQSEKLIFIYNEQDELYLLKRKIKNSNNIYSYEIFDIQISSLIFIKEDNKIYILYNKENINDNVIQYWREFKDFDDTKTLILKDNDTSLITYGDIKLQEKRQNQQENEEKIYDTNITLTKEGMITSKELQTSELTIGHTTTSYNPTKHLPFKPLFYGETTNGLYILTKSIITPGVLYQCDIKYISNKSINLEYQTINIDIGTNYYEVVSAVIYNDCLYLLIIYKLTNSDTLYSQILVYNETLHIHSYKGILTQAQIDLIGYKGDTFISSINMNNKTDIYFIYNLKIFLLFFRNQEPSELIVLKDFNPSTNEPGEQNEQVKLDVECSYYIKNNIYLFCKYTIGSIINYGYYVYDITNNKLYNEKSGEHYIPYSYNYEDAKDEQGNPIIHKYSYSLIDNEKIYFKYEGLNNIYIFDDEKATIYGETHIKIFRGNNNLFNHNVNHYTINNNIVYFIEENKNEDDIYEYTFYKYNIIYNDLTYKTKLDFYNLNVSYNSIIPMIYSNNKVLLYEINDLGVSNYFDSQISFPSVELSDTNAHIKNLVVNNDNIILGSNRVIVPGDVVSDKIIVSKNILVKDNNDLIVKDTKLIPAGGTYTPKLYYKSSKALFYYGSEANSANLRALVYQQTNKTPNLPINSDKELDLIMLSSFIYNDELYVLFIDTKNTEERPLRIYFNIYDVIKNNKNEFIITLIDTKEIIDDVNYPFIQNDNNKNKQFYFSYLETFIKYNVIYYDTQEQITYVYDILNIYNPMNKILYQCILNQNSLVFSPVYNNNNQPVIINEIQTTIFPNPPISDLDPNKNKNFSNLKFILYNDNNNTVYFIYTIELEKSGEIIYPYRIYVLDLNTFTGNTLYIKKDITSEIGDDLTLINYCMLYEEDIYLNINNQDDKNSRGIYYINDLIYDPEHTTEPKQLKLLDLFKDNAYSFTFDQDRWFIITTQEEVLRNTKASGPEKYTYYINYYSRSEHFIQSVKFAEKISYDKFGLRIPPLILDNVSVYLVDSNLKYSVYIVSIFTNLISSAKTVLNTNSIFTNEEVYLFNNFYVSKDKCQVIIDPINNNDITPKRYVDDKTNPSKTLHLTNKQSLITDGSIEMNNIINSSYNVDELNIRNNKFSQIYLTKDKLNMFYYNNTSSSPYYIYYHFLNNNEIIKTYKISFVDNNDNYKFVTAMFLINDILLVLLGNNLFTFIYFNFRELNLNNLVDNEIKINYETIDNTGIYKKIKVNEKVNGEFINIIDKTFNGDNKSVLEMIDEYNNCIISDYKFYIYNNECYFLLRAYNPKDAQITTNPYLNIICKINFDKVKIDIFNYLSLSINNGFEIYNFIIYEYSNLLYNVISLKFNNGNYYYYYLTLDNNDIRLNYSLNDNNYAFTDKSIMTYINNNVYICECYSNHIYAKLSFDGSDITISNLSNVIKNSSYNSYAFDNNYIYFGYLNSNKYIIDRYNCSNNNITTNILSFDNNSDTSTISNNNKLCLCYNVFITYSKKSNYIKLYLKSYNDTSFYIDNSKTIINNEVELYKGTIDFSPVNNNDITNKKYVDDKTNNLICSSLSLPINTDPSPDDEYY